MVPALHSAVKGVIDSLAYSGSITPNSAAPLTNVKGGTAGNIVTGSLYEFGYKMTRPSSERINVYGRTGEDAHQHEVGLGHLSVRSFDVPSRSMLSDRIEFYTDPDYCVFEMFPWDRDDGVWIYTYERLRSDVNDQSAARICLLKSTDGKVGRAFAAPVVQSFNTYLIPFSIIDIEGGSKALLCGQGSPAGIRRSVIAADGTLSTPTLSFANGRALSEGGAVNTDTAGGVLAVMRDNAGSYLQQLVSTDYGATFSAPASTGIGASTGAKPTPCLMRSANFGNRLTTMFNDRGASNRDRASSLNKISDALAASWIAPVYIGTPSTQGNGSGCVVDAQAREYLYVVARQNLPNTDMYWWTMRDAFTAYNVPPAPWQ